VVTLLDDIEELAAAVHAGVRAATSREPLPE
jgi:hypothetical protein